jgi:hypothetical protein
VLPELVELLESSPELAAASASNVLIVAWRGPMTVERVRRVDAWNQRLQSEHGQYGVIAIVEPDNTAAPDAATREETVRLTAKYVGTCAGVALVIEGTGIKHTVIRLAISTIQLVSSERVPQPVFECVDLASRWLVDRLASQTADQLVRAVAAVRAQPVR